MAHSLTAYAHDSHGQIRERLTHISARADAKALRERQARCDRFVADASRHAFATYRVVVTEARRRLGVRRSQPLAHCCRVLERDLLDIKARQYGSAGVAHLPWVELFERVRRHLSALVEAETDLVRELSETMSQDEIAELIDRWRRWESRAPSRPHPFLPHRGVSGLIAASLACGADSIWDSLQGRSA